MTAIRRKVVLYNPKAVFYTMPLGLLGVGSHLDRSRYDVVVVDGRLEADPVAAVLAHLDGALALGISVLTGDPIHDAIRVSRAAKAKRPVHRTGRLLSGQVEDHGQDGGVTRSLIRLVTLGVPRPVAKS